MITSSNLRMESPKDISWGHWSDDDGTCEANPNAHCSVDPLLRYHPSIPCVINFPCLT